MVHKYKKVDSILYNQQDDYSLSKEEYHKIYNFFVTYSCCGNQSMKKRKFSDYGWVSFARPLKIKIPNEVIYLKDKLTSIIDLDNKQKFIFTDKDGMTAAFKQLNLNDGVLNDYTNERAAILESSDSNRFLKFFYRIRDGFAHGKFILKKVEDEKMVIIQDDDKHNVTGRIVIKLDTLIAIVNAIDKNNIIG